MARLSFGENLEVVDSSGNVRTVVTSTGGIYKNGVPDGYTETLAWSSGGVSPSSMTGYGVSFISMTGTDPSTSPYTVTLGAPVPGVRKTIVLDSTAAYINTIDVDLSTNCGLVDSTNQFLAFSTLATGHQTIDLIGVTTALWAVVGVNSTVGTFNAATGIRSLNAARTS